MIKQTVYLDFFFSYFFVGNKAKHTGDFFAICFCFILSISDKIKRFVHFFFGYFFSLNIKGLLKAYFFVILVMCLFVLVRTNKLIESCYVLICWKKEEK